MLVVLPELEACQVTFVPLPLAAGVVPLKLAVICAFVPLVCTVLPLPFGPDDALATSGVLKSTRRATEVSPVSAAMPTTATPVGKVVAEPLSAQSPFVPVDTMT